MAENAIAVLTYRPHASQIEFYKKVSSFGYDVFFVVDDNQYHCDYVSGIEFLQFDDAECAAFGFKSFNPPITEKKNSKVSAWEKGLYYFCVRNKSHSLVWFLEDDVLVLETRDIPEIDKLFPAADIVSAANNINRGGALGPWHWWQFVPKLLLPTPWAGSMVCAVRLGRSALDAIDQFTQRNMTKLLLLNFRNWLLSALQRAIGNLPGCGFVSFRKKFVFIEYLFHTLALHKGLTVAVAPQLQTIVWRNERGPEQLQAGRLYHPIKSQELQVRLRSKFEHEK
jgi:hypothetical protein